MEDASKTPILPLSDGFEEASREEWTALVEKALKGRPIERALHKKTYEGVTIEALYRLEEGGRGFRYRWSGDAPGQGSRESTSGR